MTERTAELLCDEEDAGFVHMFKLGALPVNNRDCVIRVSPKLGDVCPFLSLHSNNRLTGVSD